jgi:glucosamine 6-phosphate synthetase-like amidotransferase/phosphosugar isomerase protein
MEEEQFHYIDVSLEGALKVKELTYMHSEGIQVSILGLSWPSF